MVSLWNSFADSVAELRVIYVFTTNATRLWGRCMREKRGRGLMILKPQVIGSRNHQTKVAIKRAVSRARTMMDLGPSGRMSFLNPRKRKIHRNDLQCGSPWNSQDTVGGPQGRRLRRLEREDCYYLTPFLIAD